MIKSILNELNEDNGSNYKMDVLRKHKDNELLQRVLKMAYDKVTHTYGITMKNVNIYDKHEHTLSLEKALDLLEEKFVTRIWTGNEAVEMLETMLNNLSEDDAYVIEKIIGRDLRVNVGRSNINKVFKNLIIKPPYQRCEIGTKKNVDKNIDFNQKVFSQIKMDGTYRSTLINEYGTTIQSRPGIEDIFPVIENELMLLGIQGDYALLGEMTLRGEKDRKKGNGLINSDNPPHEDIIYTIWDIVPAHEYNKKNGESNYEDRLDMLESLFSGRNFNNIEVIDYRIVNSMTEAFEHFQEVVEQGLEGTVIKAHDMKWKDGNSKQQLKVKLIIELDMRITGFTEGTGKNADYFGAITFENDEGTIKGKVGVSSMTEKIRDYIHENREEFIGQVMEVHCNDITKSKANDFYALSHPRYERVRGVDKETDTLERALEQKQMAMENK